MSESFSEPGVHFWTCPDGVTSVEVEAQGGARWDGTPGEIVTGTIEVTPGRTYKFTVGAGGTAMAWSDAASAGAVTFTNGGGGAGRPEQKRGEDGHVTLGYASPVGSSEA